MLFIPPYVEIGEQTVNLHVEVGGLAADIDLLMIFLVDFFFFAFAASIFLSRELLNFSLL
jgi:hypothetical protein